MDKGFFFKKKTVAFFYEINSIFVNRALLGIGLLQKYFDLAKIFLLAN